MRKKGIFELLAPARIGARGSAEAKRTDGVQAKPNDRLAFEVWLSAYRNHLEELCRSQNGHHSKEQPNPNHAEATPDQC